MLDALLRKGYLPAELPPLFCTSTFADCVLKQKTNLPTEFTQKKALWTVPTHHNLLRSGGLRRRLSTPNPSSFFRLAKLFDEHAKSIKGKWSSSYSHTTPRLSSNQVRAFTRINSDRSGPFALIRSSAKYVVRADIAQFYPSIYTHVIPWVLHTKAKAKQKPLDKTLIGNMLDEELRAGQSGQTKGIPIGPDTSLGIAEILLSHIDSKIKKLCKPIGGVRFIDDMELTFSKLADAEKALLLLEGELFALELQLNPAKSCIVELPHEIEAFHVTDLRAHVPRDYSPRSAWIDFFNRSFSLAKKFPSESVLRYATGSLSRTKIQSKNWDLVQALMWQSLAGDPGCLRFILDVIWNQTKGPLKLRLDTSQAKLSLNGLIERSAPAGHSSEVVWAIWAALLLNIKLSDKSADLISKMDDGFVAAAACFASNQASALDPISSRVWSSWFQSNCFTDTNWLFVYEAYRRGWMPADISKSDVKTNGVCKFLKKNNVSFINEGITSTYKPQRSPRWLTSSNSYGR